MTTLPRARLLPVSARDLLGYVQTKSSVVAAVGSKFSLGEKCCWNKNLSRLLLNHHHQARCLSSNTICSPSCPIEKLNQRSYYTICERQPLSIRNNDEHAAFRPRFLHSRRSSFSSSSSSNGRSPKRKDEDEKQHTTNMISSASSSSKTSDPPVWTWVDRVLPTRWQPYARLARMDKPIGTMLLVRT